MPVVVGIDIGVALRLVGGTKVDVVEVDSVVNAELDVTDKDVEFEFCRKTALFLSGSVSVCSFTATPVGCTGNPCSL